MKIPLKAIPVGKCYEGFTIVRLEFPHSRIHYGVINGPTLIVFDNNHCWLPW